MNKNYTLNTIKFLSMLFVVGIHTIVYVDTIGMIHFVIDSFYRMFVPLFFMIAGYFIIPKINNDNGFGYIKRYLTKTIRIITTFSLLEVILLYIKYNYVLNEPNSFKAVFNEVINLKTLYYGYDTGFFVPLWYLISICYVLVVVYAFRKNIKKLLLISFLIHIAGFILKTFFNDLSIRDALFFGLFYTTLGCYIRLNEDKIYDKVKDINNIKFIKVTFLMILLSIIERIIAVFFVKNFLDFTLLTIVGSISVFIIAIKNKEIGKDNYFCQLGQDTMGVLLFHGVLIQIIHLFCLYFSIANPLNNLWINLFSILPIYLISHYLYCLLKITMNYILKKSHTIIVRQNISNGGI